MSGFKIIIKATAHGLSKVQVEQALKAVVDSSNSGIAIQNIKAKGTSNLSIVDPIIHLEETIERRNSQINSLNKQVTTSDTQVAELEEQVVDLLRIIRDRENLSSDGDFCNCNDWRSTGSDPESGDKLKRCNICGRVGVR
jgi:hypothetical protein